MSDLISINRWAKSEFADDFAKLDNYRGLELVDTYTHGPGLRRNVHSPSLVVGNIVDSDIAIYAWISPDRVHLRPADHGLHQSLGFGTIIKDDNVTFHEPYCWITMAYSKDTLGRFEALVRYLFLARGRRNALEVELETFKADFPGACRDIAWGLARKAAPSGAMISETLDVTMNDGGAIDEDSGNTANTPGTDAANSDEDDGLQASPYKDQLQHLDQAYTEFRAGLTSQMSAIKEVHEDEKEQLQHQVQDLEGRLAVSELEVQLGVNKLTESEAMAKSAQEETKSTREEVKIAQEEATTWKDKYEGLRKMMEEALGRQF
ncbi:hypothetical protein P153DRAFT_21290 [Dothidotthia symphoricarpi CBS 119687]|uniref:Uncharacterized protein n=1 Tax=Dothidotthia symphoricarpi CBS 119687 TaxID=1392245 RepID=A0A6A6AE21_9PLEO|nr:uncharacterized protein P153DRAFT_21290 [Dothidotthia symphoricarpi CBS 119687]KAF2129533.1 hypothetical protein P153DRAFT_21290 [Dothidotthia symphoricarpi CBS 119687]